MGTEENGKKYNGQEVKLNTPSRGKPGKIPDSDLAMEIFINLVFAIPIVIYRGCKFILKKMKKAT